MVRSSYILSWRTIHGPRYIFTAWGAYTLHSDSTDYTSLETNAICFWDRHMFSEKNYQYARVHFSLPQASTSVWNNYCDQEVEFDWQHMVQQSYNIWNTLSSPISIKISNFSFNLKYACEKFVFWKKVSQDSNSSNNSKTLKKIQR